jgi:hypothetical protein
LYAGLGRNEPNNPGALITVDPSTGNGTLVGPSGFSALSGLSFFPGIISSVNDDISEINPNTYELFQNYPNPFNPTTTISYYLPTKDKVVLTIYNILGEEILKLVNNDETPGAKSVVWNGKDRFGRQVSTGVYIYRLEAGDYVRSKKMILLK